MGRRRGDPGATAHEHRDRSAGAIARRRPAIDGSDTRSRSEFRVSCAFGIDRDRRRGRLTATGIAADLESAVDPGQ
jgi:hypothetical protein